MEYLQLYNISENGFLPQEQPLTRLEEYYEPWEMLMDNLPVLNQKGELREQVDKLPVLGLDRLKSKRDYQRSYVILTLLTNSYVWCKGVNNVPSKLPKALSLPLWQVSNILGITPILTHAAVDLYNWKLKDPTGEIVLDNLDTLHTMTGTKDESWFYLVMTAIEAKGGRILKSMMEIWSEMKKDNNDVILIKLNEINRIVEEFCKIIIRMREQCQPEIFYNVLRPYLAGWENNKNLPNGLIYEGVSETPLQYAGGSAAQSSLFQTLDSFMGVAHADPYFEKIKKYMPKEHTEFIEFVKNNIKFKDYVSSVNDTMLNESFNTCLTNLTKFRKLHLGLVYDYIKHFVKQNNYLAGKGTGGTDLMPFLSTAINETRKANVK